MLQSALYAVGITLPGVQRALCTSAPRWGANLYTDIGLMALIAHFGDLASWTLICFK